jgi:hypothetical protein
MALLNADIPPIYCKVRKEYLYDFKKHQGESDECVIFGLTSMAGAATLFNIMLPNGAVFFRLPISAFFQKDFTRDEVPDMPVEALQLWNSFSYYPSVHHFGYLISQRGKYFGKDKKNILVNTYSLLIGVIQKVIFWILNTVRLLTSISVDTFLLLIMAILLFSLIIGSFGILAILPLETTYQTIRSKLQNGMLRIRTLSQKILTKCSTK